MSARIKSTYTLSAGRGGPERIRLRYNVPTRVDESGNLLLSLPCGELREEPPIAWQTIQNRKIPVAIRFASAGKNTVGFVVNEYNPQFDLIIDPILKWNTYVGGESRDVINAIAVDPADGSIYVVGSSLATWGTPVRAHNTSGLTNNDAFAARFSPTTGGLVWNTFLGGSGADTGFGVLLDSQDNLYVAGNSAATWGTPVTHHAGGDDIFLAKLNSSGSLVWNTFQGYIYDDNYTAMEFGFQSKGVVVAGFIAAATGGATAVGLFNTTGALHWSHILTSGTSSTNTDLTTDSLGSIYLTGYSSASWGSPLNAFAGGRDAYVAKMDRYGTIQWNTFLGGSGNDYGRAITLDGSNTPYLVGDSDASWGLKPLNAYSGGSDGFVVKLTTAGARSWHTFLGGITSTDTGKDIILDSEKNIYILGESSATWGSPVNAFGGGSTDFLLAKFTAAGTRTWHSFYGGAGNETGKAIGLHFPDLFFAGYGTTPQWGSPVTGSSGSDGLLARINLGPTITGYYPPTKTAGAAAFDIRIDGTDFTPSSQVQWNQNPLTITTRNGDWQIRAMVPAEFMASGLLANLRVHRPIQDWDNSYSAPVFFPVNNQLPTIQKVEPPYTVAGQAEFTVTITGTNFVPGTICSPSNPSSNCSMVRWMGSVNLETTWLSKTSLQAKFKSTDLASYQSNALTVYNPPPTDPAGGLTSFPFYFVIFNPAPSLTSLSPVSALVGTPGLDLTINGTGFYSGATVKWNTQTYSTTFVSSSQIRATIPASQFESPGTATVKVANPDSNNSESNALSFSINNPEPTITGLDPAFKAAGDAGFKLTIQGTGFVRGAEVIWRFESTESTRTPTYGSSSRLTIDVFSSDLLSPGNPTVQVVNPTPGGGPSNTFEFAIGNPIAVISSLEPASTSKGGPAFSLLLTGTYFLSGSIVRWNGSDRSTTYISPTRLSAEISATDIASAVDIPIMVWNPGPGGGSSLARTFSVTNPAPAISELSPSFLEAGGPKLNLVVKGTDLLSNSVVRWNGSDRNTTFISTTQLSAEILASDIAGPGSANVQAFNPTPGGGVSNSLAINIYNPTPKITGLNPTTAVAGGSPLSLTVNGSGFVTGSVVHWNGSLRPTSYVSGTQLTAAITAVDIGTPGTASISVVNQAPGGGTSNEMSLPIVNPVPILSSLGPNSVMARGASFTLTVQGSLFVPGAQVNWNGAARETIFVSASQLTASILGTDIRTPGTAAITVVNPTPGGGSSGPVDFTIGSVGKKAWTMMLYLAGDNNLSRALSMAVARLEEQSIQPDVNVVVQIDGDKSMDTRRFLVQKNGVYTENYNHWVKGEFDMGAESVLYQFVDWAIQEYPADHYYLAITDHGRGTQGIAWDQTSNNTYLKPGNIRNALATLFSSSQEKIDVLHLDACLMGMFELAYEFRQYANYLVASENLGWSVFAYDLYAPSGSRTEKAVASQERVPLTYAQVFPLVSRATAPRDLAVSIVEGYFNHPALRGHPRTISAVDLNWAQDVRLALDAWADAMKNNLETRQGQITFKDKIYDRRLITQKFDSRNYGTLDVNDEYVDLYDLADQIVKVTDIESVRTAGQALMDAILPMVIAEHHESGYYNWQGETPGYWNLNEAHGMSLYFPPRSGTNTYTNYVGDQIFQMTIDGNWDDFLRAYFGAMNLPVDTAVDPTQPPLLVPLFEVYLPLILK